LNLPFQPRITAWDKTFSFVSSFPMAIFDHSHLASFGRDHRARILETWSQGGTVEARLQRHPTITPRPVAGQPPLDPLKIGQHG
jgi:hypothetical protein